MSIWSNSERPQLEMLDLDKSVLFGYFYTHSHTHNTTYKNYNLNCTKNASTDMVEMAFIHSSMI